MSVAPQGVRRWVAALSGARGGGSAGRARGATCPRYAVWGAGARHLRAVRAAAGRGSRHGGARGGAVAVRRGEAQPAAGTEAGRSLRRQAERAGPAPDLGGRGPPEGLGRRGEEAIPNWAAGGSSPPAPRPRRRSTASARPSSGEPWTSSGCPTARSSSASSSASDRRSRRIPGSARARARAASAAETLYPHQNKE